MKKTLVTIVATVVATVAVLALVAYTYFHIENQAEQRFAELHRNVFTKLDAQDPVAAEQLLLAAVADEAFSAPEYQFSLNGMLAGLNSEYKKDAAAAERYTMAALAVDASAFPRTPGAFPVLPTFMLSEKATGSVLEDANSW